MWRHIRTTQMYSSQCNVEKRNWMIYHEQQLNMLNEYRFGLRKKSDNIYLWTTSKIQGSRFTQEELVLIVDTITLPYVNCSYLIVEKYILWQIFPLLRMVLFSKIQETSLERNRGTDLRNIYSWHCNKRTDKNT